MFIFHFILPAREYTKDTANIKGGYTFVRVTNGTFFTGMCMCVCVCVDVVKCIKV